MLIAFKYAPASTGPSFRPGSGDEIDDDSCPAHATRKISSMRKIFREVSQRTYKKKHARKRTPLVIHEKHHRDNLLTKISRKTQEKLLKINISNICIFHALDAMSFAAVRILFVIYLRIVEEKNDDKIFRISVAYPLGSGIFMLIERTDRPVRPCLPTARTCNV